MPTFDFTLDRAKYIQIARAHGAPAAITQLHLDTEHWERQTFDGDQGWNSELWKKLQEVRDFSRSLWDQATIGSGFASS
jgi:hypothetical protein